MQSIAPVKTILKTALFLLASLPMTSNASVFSDSQASIYNTQGAYFQSNINSQSNIVHIDNRVAYRPKREVMAQVSRQYQAKVLNIQLITEQQVYVVRILLPNGKVRDITVSAL